MRARTPIGLAALLWVVGAGTAALAASAEDFNAAFARAEAASRQAVAMKTGWSTTESELKAARSAADAGRYEEAIALARGAEALANASIAQAREQATAWTQAVIH